MVEQDFEIMESLGLNVLRLGTMWPGIEPTRGSYNESYIRELATIVQTAAKHGVYTLLGELFSFAYLVLFQFPCHSSLFSLCF